MTHVGTEKLLANDGDGFDRLWDEIVVEVANLTPEEIERELKTIDMDLNDIGKMAAELAQIARVKSSEDMKEIKCKIRDGLSRSFDQPLTIDDPSASPLEPPMPNEDSVSTGSIGVLKSNARRWARKGVRPPPGETLD
jgi:hypothetical protein